MRLPLLVFHVSAGVLAMFAGAAAISFRKGSRWHGVAGNVFVASMLVMATFASCLAYMKHQPNNVFGGLLTIYMVATAWGTARRRDRETGILDWVGFLFALAIGVLGVIAGFQKATGRAPVDDGTFPFMQLFMSSVILLAALGDLRMLLRGISGKRRIARHLWRMCFGWFIATGSFFLGQQQVFPAWLRGSPVLLVPALLPLVLLIFWMIRVRFTSAYKRMSVPSSGAYSVEA
ncbi:MAG TPA: hypothetical protein VGZ91_10040 [Candidatus Sulfotelmatobacter sp.]|jgi:uncharacterized membrane protein|nr:hypothetical protein [Candidatus Sulfotelmatobacter sp.]